MGSSTVLAFRIFVMLSCLVIVPMAAIFGSAFPDVVKTVLVDRIVAWSTGKTTESAPSGAPSGFAVVSPGSPTPPGVTEAPRWGQSVSPSPAWHADAAPSRSVVPATAAGSPPSANQPASFAEVESPRPTQSVYAPDQAAAVAPARAAPLEVAPLPQNVPASHGGPDANGPRPEPAGHAAAQPPERFTVMERRLREYGATYYLLETWGNEGELYRFHCKMAIGNNPNYTRHFEATDRDALKAIAQVLEKVEMWRAGRLQ